MESPFESASTLKAWVTYHELAESFIAELPPAQTLDFQALQANQAEGLSMSFEDSFIFGFQTAARIFIEMFH